MMHRSILLFTLMSFAFLEATQAQVATPRPSPKSVLTQSIGITDVTITYSRPGVKGRTIWGELVPFDKVWRTGANEATNFKITDDVKIEGKTLSAGSYSLATVPGKDSWIVIFNKRDDLWGAMGYKQEEDALRVTVKPESAPHREWMEFSFEDLSENSAVLALYWEKLRVPVKIEVDTRELVLSKARKAISYAPSMNAAIFCMQRDILLDEAMKWIDISLMIDKNYWNSRVKAQLLAKAGKKKEAITTMEEAIAMGGKMTNAPFDFDAMKRLLADWKK